MIYPSSSPPQRPTHIEQARTQAEALFLSIGEGAIATDQKGKISRINKVALDLLGYKKEEILGKPFLEVIKSVDQQGQLIEPFDRPITQVFVMGKPITLTTFYLRKNLAKFPVSITVSPVVMDGKPVGAIEVFRDITKEHEIDRMKSEFISIASHQLRTPLTAIKTYAHMLSKGFAGELNSSQHEFIAVVLSSADHMNRLIDTLLDISLIEAGKLSVVPKKINLSTFINDLVKEFTKLAEEKHIKLTFKLGKLPTHVLIDPLLTREVCANLLSNAIKYTPKNGTVSFSLQQKNTSLLLAIKDSGHGIPVKHQERIFGKFFRAPNVMSLDANGSGLGLYMVRGIAENLGGRTWFESREGKGSTFYFSLPLLPQTLSKPTGKVPSKSKKK